MKRWARYSLVFTVVAGVLGIAAGLGFKGATANSEADGQIMPDSTGGGFFWVGFSDQFTGFFNRVTF